MVRLLEVEGGLTGKVRKKVIQVRQGTREFEYPKRNSLDMKDWK